MKKLTANGLGDLDVIISERSGSREILVLAVGPDHISKLQDGDMTVARPEGVLQMAVEKVLGAS